MATLARRAARYGERAIALRGGRLYHERGARPESPLTPMARGLFEIVADPALRIRFVSEGDRPAVKLIEISSDGSIEQAVTSR